MTASQSAVFNLQEFTDAGLPLVGGRLYTYVFGTTTQKTAYTDPAGTIPQTYTADGLGGQYIALNARGELPTPLYLATGPYDIALKRADGSAVWTRRAEGVGSLIELLAGAGGSALVGFQQSGGGDVTTVQAALRAELVNVLLHRIAGEADDTAMFNRAIAAAKKVYVPSGTYYVSSATLLSNTEIYGDGDSTVIRMLPDWADIFRCDSGSSSVGSNITGIKISNLQLRATCDTDGFSEQKHLVRLNGVTNLLVENVLFRGFRGDGLYIGSGITAGDERHNEFVRVINCRFDGINNLNRNGITFIDVDDVVVDKCKFSDISRSDMPGAINFEPDNFSFHIIRNVIVKNNKFERTGGNVGDICVLIPASVTTPATNITFKNNTSLNYAGTGNFITFRTARLSTETSVRNAVRIQNNYVSGGFGLFSLLDGKGIDVRDNLWVDMKQGALIGYIGATNRVRDVTIKNDRLIRCGTVGGAGIAVYAVDNLTIKDTEITDCGTGGGASYGVNFAAGSSSRVSFYNVYINSPTGKTLAGIFVAGTHVMVLADNRFFGNNLNGLSNNFTAYESDTITGTFAVTVKGGTSSGTATYVSNVGWWKKAGSTIEFAIRVIWTGHTGTGQTYIQLPFDVATAGIVSFIPLAMTMEGAIIPNNCCISAMAFAPDDTIRIYYTSNTSGGLGTVDLPSAGTITVAGRILTS